MFFGGIVSVVVSVEMVIGLVLSRWLWMSLCRVLLWV